jgi:four helix bundle protein
MKRYKDIEIYNEAFRLAQAVYLMTQELTKAGQFEPGSQVRRFAQSVRCNIVEGYGRKDSI